MEQATKLRLAGSCPDTSELFSSEITRLLQGSPSDRQALYSTCLKDSYHFIIEESLFYYL